jgi:hypothetical protein
MKRRVFLLLSLVILALSGPGPLFAWDGAFFDLFQVPFSPREAALGGNHAAQADDVSTLKSNPAGFQSVDPELSIGSIDLSAYSWTNGPGGGARTQLDLFGPLSIAYVGNGLGFGLFTDSSFYFRNNGGPPLDPAANAQITENLVMIAGYAFRVPLPDSWLSTLDVGFTVPLFLAARSTVTNKDARGLLASVYTLNSFVLDQPFETAVGLSVEFGVLYAWNNTFSVGLTGRNLAITSANTYTSLQAYEAGVPPISTAATPLPMDISIGIRWNPPIKMRTSYIDGLTILADYNDIFDFIIYPAQARNPLLHLGFGLEITLLKVVELRAGFYQLLPSGGLSIDLSFFTLDVAVFGRELSTQPWTTPVYGYMAGIRFHT